MLFSIVFCSCRVGYISGCISLRLVGGFLREVVAKGARNTLEAKEITIADSIKTSNQVLASAIDQIERAHEMISRANVLLSKAEPVCKAKNT